MEGKTKVLSSFERDGLLRLLKATTGVLFREEKIEAMTNGLKAPTLEDMVSKAMPKVIFGVLGFHMTYENLKNYFSRTNRGAVLDSHKLYTHGHHQRFYEYEKQVMEILYPERPEAPGVSQPKKVMDMIHDLDKRVKILEGRTIGLH